jgi:hypothetical protein
MNTNHPNITLRTTRSSVDYSAIPVREFYSRIPVIPGSTVTTLPVVNRFSAATTSPVIGVGLGASNSVGNSNSVVGSSYSGSPIVPVVNPVVASSVPLSLVNPSLIQSNPAVVMSSSHIGHTGITPKRFSGNPNERVEDFLHSYNFYAECHKWSDDLKCRGLREFLEGKAKLWYESMWYRGRKLDDAVVSGDKKEEVEKAAEVLSSWRKLESAMLTTFVTEDEKMMLRLSLQNRHQQKTEKILDYALLKQNWINRLDPCMSEAEKLQYFVFGLQPQFQLVIIPKKCKTLDEAIELAKDYERGLDVAQGTVSSVYNVNGMNQIGGANGVYNIGQDYSGMMNNQVMYQPNVAGYNYNLGGANYNPIITPTPYFDMNMMQPQLQYDINAVTNNRPNFHFRNNAANNAPAATPISSNNNQDAVNKQLLDTLAELKKEIQSVKSNANVGTSSNSSNIGVGYDSRPGWIDPKAGTCFYCGKPGHSKMNCNKMKRDNEANGVNNRSGNYQGRFNNNRNNYNNGNYNNMNRGFNNNGGNSNGGYNGNTNGGYNGNGQSNYNNNNNQGNYNNTHQSNNNYNNNQQMNNNNNNAAPNNHAPSAGVTSTGPALNQPAAPAAAPVTNSNVGNGSAGPNRVHVISSASEVQVKNDPLSGNIESSVYSIPARRRRPMTTDGSINGISVDDVLVDTGADITVMSSDTLNKLNIPRSSLNPTMALVNDASKSSLGPIGTIKLNLALHGVSIEPAIDFVVLDKLHAAVIVGDDVLLQVEKYGFTGIDFITNTLRYKNSSIPLTTSSPSIDSGIYEISMTTRVTIPAFGEVITVDTRVSNNAGGVVSNELRVEENSGSVLMIEPMEIPNHEQSVRAVRSIINIDVIDQIVVPVRLANFSSKNIDIEAGTPVANIQAVESLSVIGAPEGFVWKGDTSPTNITNNRSDNGEEFKASEVCSVGVQDLSTVIVTKDEVERGKIGELLMQFPDVFADNPKKPTQTDKTTHSIITGDAAPIKLPPYRNARVDDAAIEKEIAQLLEHDLIRVSNSPWSAPVVMVMKKTGEKRFCVDYRKLNAVTKKHSYPLPQVTDLIDSLGTKEGKKKYYSQLDLASAYWSVKVNEEDREKTAFVTKQGLFEWKVMPFGLCNAPATFQRLMDALFGSAKFKYVVVYFDDIVVFSDSFEEHLQHLRSVFRILSDAGLQAKLSKCKFGLSEVSFLGFIIGGDGVKPDPATVRAVADYRVPRNVSEVRAFLGLCSFYRCFILGFAAIANPLNRLTGKDVEFNWDSSAQSAFNQLKSALIKAPILATPDFGKPFILTTDASKFAIGAVLSQFKDGMERVIRFASRTMGPAERNYSVTEKECLAIVWAIGMFRSYLLGVPFKIITDHKPLESLPKLKLDDPYGRLARWALKLQHYDYTVVYTKGSGNTNADALSRIGEDEPVHAPIGDGVEFEEGEDANDVNNINVGSPVINANSNLINPNPTGSNPSVIILTDPAAFVPASSSAVNEECKTSEKEIIDLTRFEDQPTPDALKEIAEKQRADPILGQMIKYLTEGVIPSDENHMMRVLLLTRRDYEVVNGVLYYYSFPRKGNDSTKWRKTLCVPDSMKDVFLKLYHDAMGHLGIRKTYDRMAMKLHWNKMHADVENWIKSCLKCNGRKDPRTGERWPIGTFVTSGEPCSEWQVDVLGPFSPTSRSNNKYIVVFVCRFTKWVEAFAVPNQDSETIARLLVQEIIPRHGCPRSLLSDRGSPFLSKLSKSIYELLSIKKLNTTAYHPQANGGAERLMPVIATMLSVYSADYPNDWDEHLNYCLFAIRTAVHDTTKYSPFFLMYGRDPAFPFDAMMEVEEKYRTNEEYVNEVIRKLKLAQAVVKNNALQVKLKRDKANEKLNKIRSFNVGDFVMLYVPRTKPGISSKLSHKWKGPYTVISQTGPVNYIIKNIVDSTKTDHVHVSRLKPCVQREITSGNVTFSKSMELDDSVDIDLTAPITNPITTTTATTTSAATAAPSSAKTRAKPKAKAPVRAATSVCVDAAVDESEDDGEPQFEVERIVGKGWEKVDGEWVAKYQVRWRGFTAKDDTWEPLSNLVGSERLVEKFDSENEEKEDELWEKGDSEFDDGDVEESQINYFSLNLC